MWLRKHVTPGAAPGGYTWDSADHAVEVPEDLAHELLGIGGFEVVEAPTGAGPDTEPDDEADAADEPDEAEVIEAPVAPKKRPGRKPATPAVSE